MLEGVVKKSLIYRLHQALRAALAASFPALAWAGATTVTVRY